MAQDINVDIALIGAGGVILGSVLNQAFAWTTSFIDHRRSTAKQWLPDKKEAYINLLYHMRTVNTYTMSLIDTVLKGSDSASIIDVVERVNKSTDELRKSFAVVELVAKDSTVAAAQVALDDLDALKALANSDNTKDLGKLSKEATDKYKSDREAYTKAIRKELGIIK